MILYYFINSQKLICIYTGLEHLPIELQRNFTLMRDLDARAQSLMKDIDKLADDYLRNLKKESSEKSKEQLSHIQSLFNKAKEYGDDKVQLAIQTYELVDKHIRRLDSDLARFEAEIQDKALNSSRAQEEGNASKKGRKKLKEEKRKKKGTVSSEDEFKTPRKKQKKGTFFVLENFSSHKSSPCDNFSSSSSLTIIAPLLHEHKHACSRQVAPLLQHHPPALWVAVRKWTRRL